MFDDVNAILSQIAEEEQQIYLAQQMAAFLEDQEHLELQELMKQHEMMSRAADLENFSPFDTINS